MGWVDETLEDWPDDDYRIYVGDLGNEVTTEHLTRAFSVYPSFLRAKVIRNRQTQKTKGYGFVSMGNADDYISAMKEMQGKYLGKRPLNLRKSDWHSRTAKDKDFKFGKY